jgi:DNA repair protein RadD
LKIRDHFFKSTLYGCTATPLRLDNYGLGNNFESMVIGPSYDYLISKGFLSKPRYYVPEHINLDDVKKNMGDYNKHELGERFANNKYIIGNAIEFYSKLGEYKPCMVFCVNINEANKTAEQFKKAGYKAISIHSKMNYMEIKKGITDLRDGKIHVITSCDMIGEGTDIPRIEIIIQLRPTLSLCVNHQQNGRGLRPYPGKEYSIHIDQVGNCERHGLIHWPINWRLTKEKFEPKIPVVKICQFCFAAYPAYMKRCPECKNENIKKERNGPEEKQGELKQIDYKTRNEEIENTGNLSELLSLATKYNYSPAWAYHMFKRKVEASK